MNRTAAVTLLAACALPLGACPGDPTGPVRPPEYRVVFIGAPAWADAFVPVDVDGGRVVGFALVGTDRVAAQWVDGAFSAIGLAPPPGCASVALGARGGRTVGQVTCGADAYGWASSGPEGRVAAPPHTFTDVSVDGLITGTLRPSPFGDPAQRRAFIVAGSQATLLLPPGADGSEAAGISDDGAVAVTAYGACAAGGCGQIGVQVWDAGAWTMIDPPRSAVFAEARAVSTEGHVLGMMVTESGLDRPFLWTEDDGAEELAVLPGTLAQAYDVNADGLAVGTATRTALVSETAGVAWSGARIYYLTDKVQGGVWQVIEALAIDDDGNVAAYARNPETGAEGPVLLVPAE